MAKNPHANFSPTLLGYTGQGAFRFWCQMALPLTYDDSLSYYELLNKVVTYLNNTIEDVANVETNVSALSDAYNQLQKYVNDYFDDLDVEEELRNVLDKMALDGSLDAILTPLVEVALPDIVDDKIDAVVADQIGGVVAEQIPAVVENQLPPLIDENVPDAVSDWLNENVDPVGSAVAVDSTLSIQGAAADAKKTGDEINLIKNNYVKNDILDNFSEKKLSVNSMNFLTNLNELGGTIDSIPGVKKFENKTFNSSNVIVESTGTNTASIRCFYVPYYGFSFIGAQSYTKICVLNSMPEGDVGEQLDFIANIEGVTEDNGPRYTFNYHADKVICVVFMTAYKGSIVSAIFGEYESNNLRLNKYQNDLSLYKTNLEKTDIIPFEIAKSEGKLISSTTGSISNNVSYDTHTFMCPVKHLSAVCASATRVVKTKVNPVDIHATSGTYVIEAIQHSSAIEFEMNYGEWVGISLPAGTTLNLTTDVVSKFALNNLVSAPDLESAPKLISGITELDNLISAPLLELTKLQSGKNLYNYNETHYSSLTQKYLDIYFKTSENKYVGYRLKNVPSTSHPERSNTWQLGAIKGYSFDGESMTKDLDITDAGEFESAIKENGASDFNGGVNHGDEKTLNFYLFVDGKIVNDLTTLPSTLSYFNDIEAVEISELYHVDNTELVPYATHEKHWFFKDKKVRVEHSIKFIESVDISGWMCVMFKAIRSVLPYGTRLNNVGVEDMSGNSWSELNTFSNEFSYTFWGDNVVANISGHSKLHENDETRFPHKNISKLSIDRQNSSSASVPDCNKLYFSYWGDTYTNNAVTMNINDVVYAEGTFEVIY